MLIGEYDHSLDSKGRLIMPAKLREDMGEKFIITTGLDGCLFGFSMEEWKKFEDKLKTLPITNKNARNFVRFFLSGATECELDKQGRFLIVGKLRENAKLEKDVTIIGTGTRIEIWNKEKWQEHISEENLSIEDIEQNMEELGI
ncbi:MAG: division/cell wall cluster transcriptional repressor MraZ [Christensenellales bacterium]